MEPCGTYLGQVASFHMLQNIMIQFFQRCIHLSVFDIDPHVLIWKLGHCSRDPENGQERKDNLR